MWVVRVTEEDDTAMNAYGKLQGLNFKLDLSTCLTH